MRVDSWELPLSAIPLCQLLHVILGLPGPSFPSTCMYVKGHLDCTLRAFHMSIPVEPSLLQNEVRSSMPSCAAVAHWTWWWQCLVAWQICLIIALSFCCWQFGFVNGQVSLAWSFALCTQELCTRPHALKERWREERTGSRSLNFFWVAKEATTSRLSGPTWTSLCGLQSKGHAFPWHLVHL